MHSFFQIIVRGNSRLWENLGGAFIFVFLFNFYAQCFEVFWRGTWGAPLLPVCIYAYEK